MDEKKQKFKRLAINLDHSVLRKVSLHLNPDDVCGADWRQFAGEIGMTYLEIQNIAMRRERFMDVFNHWCKQDNIFVTDFIEVLRKIRNESAIKEIEPYEYDCVDDEQTSGNTRNVNASYKQDLFNQSSYTYNEGSSEELKKVIETNRILAKCVSDLFDENRRLKEAVNFLQTHGCLCRNRVTSISKNQFEPYDLDHKNALGKNKPSLTGPPIECTHAAKSNSNEYQDRRENYRQEDTTAAAQADENPTFSWTTTVLIGCSLIKCSEDLKIESERIHIKSCFDASEDDIKSYAEPLPNCIILHVGLDVFDEYGKSYVDKAVEIIALAKSVTKVAKNNIRVSVSGLILRCDEHDPTRARVNFILRELCAAEKWYYFDHPNIYPTIHLDERKSRLNSAGIEILAKSFLRAAQQEDDRKISSVESM